MLLIKTALRFSNSKGLGVFADEEISQNTILWIRDENFDKLYNENDLTALPELASFYIRTYAVLECTGLWYLSCDNDRFCNHSYTPNTRYIFNENGLAIKGIAIADIKFGEEIFCDYSTLCLTCMHGLPFEDM